MTVRSDRRKGELVVIETARRFVGGSADEHDLMRALEDLDALPLDKVDGSKPSSLAPDTSWEAYRSMKERFGADAKQVFDLIYEYWRRGQSGLTVEEICLKLDRKHQSISARVNELRDRGFVMDSFERRKTTSGRNAVVWQPSTVALFREEMS